MIYLCMIFTIILLTYILIKYKHLNILIAFILASTIIQLIYLSIHIFNKYIY